jgi:hypothetical protein
MSTKIKYIINTETGVFIGSTDSFNLFGTNNLTKLSQQLNGTYCSYKQKN